MMTSNAVHPNRMFPKLARPCPWATGLVPLALTLYTGYRLRDFLREGLPIFFDAHSHLTQSWLAARSLAAGFYPSWSFEWYEGFRLLEFYSPAYQLLVGSLGLVLPDVVVATKLVLWTGQVLSVLALYAFLRRFIGDVLLAAFGALLLTESAQRAWVLGVVGNHPSVMLYVMIPLVLWLVAGASTDPCSLRRLWPRQALCLGAMAAAHLTNTLAVLPGLVAFELAWLWQVRRSNQEWCRGLRALGGSLVAVAGLTAFIVIPVLVDLHLVSLSLDVEAPPRRTLDAEPLLILAGRAPFTWDHVFLSGEDGFLLIVALAMGLLSLRRGEERFRPLLAGMCASLASVVLIGDRAVLALPFFVFALCSGALGTLTRTAEAVGLPRARPLVPILAIGAVLLAPRSFQPARYEPSDALDVYRELPSTPTRSRTFDVTPSSLSVDGFYGPSSFSPYVSGRSIPFGAFPPGASLASQLTLALFGKVVQDLDAPEPELSEDALDILHLSHVQFLIDRGKRPVFARLRVDAEIASARGERVLELRHASPALFAPRLSELPAPYRTAVGADDPPLLGLLEEERRRAPQRFHPLRSVDALARAVRKRDWSALLPLVEAMGIDRVAARADRIFTGRPLALPPGAQDEPPEFAVLHHREDLVSVEIVARASASGFVRLAYAHDPHLAISLDDGPAVSVPDSLGGAIVLAFPAGTHKITVRAPEPRLRLLLLGGSIALTLALVVWLLVARAYVPPQSRQG